MRTIWWCLFIISDFIIVSPTTVPNVRLVDHTNYAISVMQATMRRVEERCWCNLKIDDIHVSLSENFLGTTMSAEIDLKNGFVVSIQKIGIIQHTIQQHWLPRTGNTTRVEIQSTVQMIDVAIGFDVVTKLAGKVSHSTGLIVYNDIQFKFTISKHLFTDEISVDVAGSVQRITNRMQFTPENDVTKVLTIRFDWNSVTPSITKWASDIFKPITLELATKEIEFPRICYNCNL